jgi:hypothetical protein
MPLPSAPRAAPFAAAVPAVLTAVAILLSGCSTTPPASPTASPSNSPDKPVFASDEEALAAAEAALEEYVSATDAVFQEAGDGVDVVKPLVTEDWFTELQASATEFRRQSWRQAGATSYEIQGLQDTSERAGVRYLVLYACVDYSKFHVLNAEGAALDRVGEADRTILEVSLQSDKRAPQPTFLVGEVEAWPEKKC